MYDFRRYYWLFLRVNLWYFPITPYSEGFFTTALHTSDIFDICIFFLIKWSPLLWVLYLDLLRSFSCLFIFIIIPDLTLRNWWGGLNVSIYLHSAMLLELTTVLFITRDFNFRQRNGKTFCFSQWHCNKCITCYFFRLPLTFYMYIQRERYKPFNTVSLSSQMAT